MEKQQRSESDVDNANQPAKAAGAPEQAEQGPAPDASTLHAAAQLVIAKLSEQAQAQQGSETGSKPSAGPGTPEFLHRAEQAIAASGEKIVHDAVAMAGGVKQLAVKVGAQLEVVAGEAVGVAELAGVRYPVKPYEAQVDAGLYRGSRLDDAGMAALKQQGIKGVVSLCLEHTDDAVLAKKYGLESLNVQILDNSAPTVAQMMEFITFARAHAPSYVHCEAGKGRTGTAVACYRIAVDGWTADRAIDEARGFGLSLVNQIAFIRSFAETLQGRAPAAATPAPAGAEAQTAPEHA